jgi:adenylate cyclase
MDAGQHAFAAAAYSWLGDRTAACAHHAQIAKADPQFTIEAFVATLHYASDADLQHLVDGLKACSDC